MPRGDLVDGKAYRWANARIRELEAERERVAQELEVVKQQRDLAQARIAEMTTSALPREEQEAHVRAARQLKGTAEIARGEYRALRRAKKAEVESQVLREAIEGVVRAGEGNARTFIGVFLPELRASLLRAQSGIDIYKARAEAAEKKIEAVREWAEQTKRDTGDGICGTAFRIAMDDLLYRISDPPDSEEDR